MDDVASDDGNMRLEFIAELYFMLLFLDVVAMVVFVASRLSHQRTERHFVVFCCNVTLSFFLLLLAPHLAVLLWLCPPTGDTDDDLVVGDASHLEGDDGSDDVESP